MTIFLNKKGDLTATAQDLYEASATQKHDLGSRLQIGDRVFRYVKAGGNLDPDTACWDGNFQVVSFATAPVAYPAGSSELKVTVGATDGPAHDGVLAKDYLKGGYLVVFSDTVGTFVMEITGNTAVASGGGTTTVTVLGHTPEAVSASDSFIEACANPYINVKCGNHGGYRACLGVAMTDALVSGYYGWIQTWGPTWIAPQGTVGAAANNNQVVFRHDGSIQLQTASDGLAQYAQHAGYVMHHAYAGTQSAPFVFLQVAP